MSKCHIIQFASEGITDKTCHATYFSLLSAEGNVAKLYLDYDKRFGKAYFKDKSEAIAVHKKLKADPRFEVTEELAVEEFRRRGQKQKSPRMSSEDVEVVEEVVYDVFGNSLPVFVNEDGDSYIPRSELERSGFKLYGGLNELPVHNERDRQAMIEYLKTQGEFFCYKHFNRLPDQCDTLLHQAIMTTISRTSTLADPQETSQKDQSNSFGNNNRKLSSASRTSFDNNKSASRTYANESQDTSNRFNRSNERNESQDHNNRFNRSNERNESQDHNNRFNRSNERNNQTRGQPQRYSAGSEKSYGSAAEKPRLPYAKNSFNGPDSQKKEESFNRSADNEARVGRKSEPDSQRKAETASFNRSTDNDARVGRKSEPFSERKEETASFNRSTDNDARVGRKSEPFSERKEETASFNRSTDNDARVGRKSEPFSERKEETASLNRSTDVKTGEQSCSMNGSYGEQEKDVPKPQQDRSVNVPRLRKPETVQKVAKVSVPKRSNIVDKLAGTSGFLQCCQVNADGSFVASLIPALYGPQIEMLSDLQSYALQQPIDKADVGDVVGVKFSWCGEDSVARAVVADCAADGEYTVAIVDYGRTEKRRELYRLKKDDADIIDFAVVCTACSGFEPVNEELYEYAALQGDKILIEKEHEVSCGPWYDTVGGLKKTAATDVQKIVKERPKTDELKVGDQCLIVNEENGALKIRTKTGFALVKSLIASLQEHKATKLAARPEADQLVLCDNNGTLARAAIAEITGDVARLCLIDTGESCILPVQSLFYIDGFHETPGTLHSVKLKHFEDKTFSGLVRSYLKTIYKREKFKIVSVSGDVVELENSTGTNLSGKLKNMDKPPYKTVKDLPSLELKVGEKKEYMVAYVQAEDGVIFLFPDTDGLTEVAELLEDHPVNETLPLNMHVGELCLSKYEGMWSRAFISKIDNVGKKYEVCYIDFGNYDTVPQDNVREYPTKLLKYPPMAVKCLIEDVVTKFGTPLPPNVANVLNSLSDISLVTAHVLSKADNDVYNISVPIVVQAME